MGMLTVCRVNALHSVGMQSHLQCLHTHTHIHADWVRASHAETQTNAIHTHTDTSRGRAVTHMLSSSDPNYRLMSEWKRIERDVVGPNTFARTRARTLVHLEEHTASFITEEYPARQPTMHTPTAPPTYTQSESPIYHTHTHTMYSHMHTCMHAKSLHLSPA